MRQHGFNKEGRSCTRIPQSTRMILAARLEKTCGSPLCQEPKVRHVRSFRAKATSWIQNPLPLRNSGLTTTPPRDHLSFDHPGLARSKDSAAQWVYAGPENDIEIPPLHPPFVHRHELHKLH
jgi:hypothetical protein